MAMDSCSMLGCNDVPSVSSTTNNSAERRRANKPLMEKKRRARINQSLTNLRNLILDYVKNESNRSTKLEKLEKADILESTLSYVQDLQRHQAAMNAIKDSRVVDQFQAGYGECIQEVRRYLRSLEGVDVVSIRKILCHIADVGHRKRANLISCKNESVPLAAISGRDSTLRTHSAPRSSWITSRKSHPKLNSVPTPQRRDFSNSSLVKHQATQSTKTLCSVRGSNFGSSAISAPLSSTANSSQLSSESQFIIHPRNIHNPTESTSMWRPW